MRSVDRSQKALRKRILVQHWQVANECLFLSTLVQFGLQILVLYGAQLHHVVAELEAEIAVFNFQTVVAEV